MFFTSVDLFFFLEIVGTLLNLYFDGEDYYGRTCSGSILQKDTFTLRIFFANEFFLHADSYFLGDYRSLVDIMSN
jgi:hypothetical protein